MRTGAGERSPRPMAGGQAGLLVALVGLVGLALLGLLALPAPDLRAVPNQASYVRTECAPAPGSRGPRARACRVRLGVRGLGCATCAGTLLETLAAVPGVCSARIDMAHGSVQVEYQPTVTRVETLMAVSSRAGYPATAYSDGVPVHRPNRPD